MSGPDVRQSNSMYDTILVPTDGSDPANRAVEHALALADRYDARVHALYCVETHRYGEPALSSTEIVLDQLEDQGKRCSKRRVIAQITLALSARGRLSRPALGGSPRSSR